jgi:DNA-binding LacI/PurR family transcriptional regulator
MIFKNVDFEDPKFLYTQVADMLEEKITNKEFAVGNRIPTIRELHKELGVGIDTIKDALSKLERDGYIAKRRSHGTFVINTEPRKGRTLEVRNEISLVVSPYEQDSSDFRKHYPHVRNSRIIKGIEEKVRENGAYLIYSTIEDEKLSIEGKENDIAGLILSGDITPKVFRAARKSGIPFVCIGDVRGKTGTGEEADVIAVDDFAGTYQAAKHLIDKGHKRIVYLYQTQEYLWDREELRGYVEALRDAGIDCDPELQIKTGEAGLEGGYIAIKKALEQSLAFTGIVSVVDTMNTGILLALKEKNLRVPEDVGVVSIGGMPELTPVTSVVDDWEEMGRTAAERIIERIKDPGLKPERIVVPFKTIA